jgi:hypothetical protein
LTIALSFISGKEHLKASDLIGTRFFGDEYRGIDVVGQGTLYLDLKIFILSVPALRRQGWLGRKIFNDIASYRHEHQLYSLKGLSLCRTNSMPKICAECWNFNQFSLLKKKPGHFSTALFTETVKIPWAASRKKRISGN